MTAAKGRKPSDNTRLAILENELVTLRASLSGSNSAVESRLTAIQNGIKEIHDKIDQHMLNQAVEITTLKVKQEGYEKEMSKLESKIFKAGSIAGTIVAAVITGGFQYLKN